MSPTAFIRARCNPRCSSPPEGRAVAILTCRHRLTQLGTRTGAKRRAWFSRSTSRTLRTAIRVMGVLTGGSLRRPSQAVRNHRTAVRLRRDSLAAIVWMQRGLGQLGVTNHRDLLPGWDGRSAGGRRFRDLVSQRAVDQGGFDKLSEARVKLVIRSDRSTARSEPMTVDSPATSGAQIVVRSLSRSQSSTSPALPVHGLSCRPSVGHDQTTIRGSSFYVACICAGDVAPNEKPSASSKMPKPANRSAKPRKSSRSG